MFRKTRFVIAMALVASSGSSSFALFNLTATLAAASPGLEQWRIQAINTGGETGTQVRGLVFNYAGSRAAFEVNDWTNPLGGLPDGIGDTANLLSSTRTRVRLSTVAPNNQFFDFTPDPGPVQPNAYDAGVAAFSGTITNTGTTQASGAGFEIARFYIPTGGSFVFSGFIGGEIGQKQAFSVQVGPIAPEPTSLGLILAGAALVSRRR